MAKDRYPYTVKPSGWTLGHWAVFKDGSETTHAYKTYERAVRKAQKLNRRIARRESRR